MTMLTEVLVPTAGSATVCGLDPVRQRRELARRIGVVFGQRSQLWWDLPLADSFELLGGIHRVPVRGWRRGSTSASNCSTWPVSWPLRSGSCRSASACAAR